MMPANKNHALTWEEFSLEWIGRASGVLVVSVMGVPGNQWHVLPRGGGSHFFCDSLEEAKDAAEEWYRNHGTSMGWQYLDSDDDNL